MFLTPKHDQIPACQLGRKQSCIGLTKQFVDLRAFAHAFLLRDSDAD